MLGRVAEESGAHKTEGLFGVGDQNDLGSGRLHRLLSQNRRSSLGRGLSGEPVPIGGRALDAHKQAPGLGLAGVVGNIADGNIGEILGDVQGGQKLGEEHRNHPF